MKFQVIWAKSRDRLNNNPTIQYLLNLLLKFDGQTKEIKE